MKINFNTTSYKPNFKANFAKDAMTKGSISELASENPTYVLAAHYALNDISANDVVSITNEGGVYNVHNLHTGKKQPLSNNFSNLLVPMMVLFTKENNVKNFFGVKDSSQLSMIDYINKAINVIQKKEKFAKKAEMHTMKNELQKLVEKRDELQKKIDVLTKKIESPSVDVKNRIAQEVYDIVFF